jgi:hypothetical protein
MNRQKQLKRAFRTVKKGYGRFVSGVQRANFVAAKISVKARKLEKRVITPSELIFGSELPLQRDIGSPSDYLFGSNEPRKRRRVGQL